MTSFSAGLDFGTSNSTIGVAAANGGVALAPVEGAHHTLPSAVFFDFERDQVLHGRAAMKAYVEGIDGRLLRALKSVLGSSLINETTQVRRRRVPFAEIIGLFLKRLKLAAETAAGGPVDKVVLGRPVRFVDHDDEADRQAERELAEIATAQGFAHVAFQLEPVAAALDHETSLAHEELAMIVDLGGGTSDFALIRLSPERARKVDRSEDILGRSGVHIGGTDFDRLLSVARVMPELGLQARIGPKHLPMPNWVFQDLATWHRIPFLYATDTLTYLRSLLRSIDRPDLIERLIDVIVQRKGHGINAEVEAAKIALSDAAVTTLKLPFDEPVTLAVTRDELEAALNGAIGDIVAGMDRCLDEAGVGRQAVGSVFLTGGSTAIPAVRARVLGHLPNARPVEGDAFGSVGLGLTIDAARRFGPGRN